MENWDAAGPRGSLLSNLEIQEQKEDLESPSEGVFFPRTISQNLAGPFPRHQKRALKDLREAQRCAVVGLSRGGLEELFQDPRKSALPLLGLTV